MNVDSEAIIDEYLSFKPTKEIARAHNLDKGDVRLILKNALPLDIYLRIAHSIGGRVVVDKLQDPLFRRGYSQKMSQSVKSALHTKMKNKVFRERWKAKAASASAKGNCQIKKLLKNKDFLSSWSKRCSFGGIISKKSQKGIFDPNLASKRKKWSMLGLQRTGRKIKGPLGEKMYNHLEVRVADILLSLGLTYAYGKVVPANNLNNFFSIDFVIKEVSVIIEVTYWDKISQKCLELKRKFSRFENIFPNYIFVVATTKSKHDKYKRLLPDNIFVLTPNQLGQFIAGSFTAKR